MTIASGGPYSSEKVRVLMSMTRVALCAAIVLLAGCSAAGDGGPCELLSTPGALTPVQQALIADARDQWCARTGWCPTIIVGGDVGARIELWEPDSPPPVPGAAIVGAHTLVAEQVIQVHPWALDSEMAWVVIAHEMGHLQGIGHHGPDEHCTMFWRHLAPSYILECE